MLRIKFEMVALYKNVRFRKF